MVDGIGRLASRLKSGRQTGHLRLAAEHDKHVPKSVIDISTGISDPLAPRTSEKLGYRWIRFDTRNRLTHPTEHQAIAFPFERDLNDSGSGFEANGHPLERLAEHECCA